MSEFARGFRLHPPRSGPVFEGAAFPSGHAVVLDDPKYGFVTFAESTEELLRGGYHGARIEWAGREGCAECADYLERKRQAESPEAAATPLVDPANRTEATLRERIAAALFEQNIRIPWAMAYPDDVINYLGDADAFLAVRDAELQHLRDRIAELEQPAPERSDR
ncbi:hypothetical protein ACWD7Y_05185 [Streptomyces drozdowiczii]